MMDQGEHQKTAGPARFEHMPPEKGDHHDDTGQAAAGQHEIDPRQRFEVAADIQGMVLLARAGYDPRQASAAWQNVLNLTNSLNRAEEQGLGDMAEQLRQMQAMMRLFQQQMRTSLGQSGLTRTIADTPPSRPALVDGYVNLTEVRESLNGGHGEQGVKDYQAFIRKILLPRAERLMEDEMYQQAETDYRNLYRKGFREAPVLYGLAKCALGDFAFAATEGQKKEAESLYREAAQKDRRYAAPWKALGALITKTGSAMTMPWPPIRATLKPPLPPRIAKKSSAKSNL